MNSDDNISKLNYEYLSRIQQHYFLLSDSEKKIADYIMKENDVEKMSAELLKMTINELAMASGTSSATAVRFCKTLGFKGLTEFKFYIEKGFLAASDQPLSVDEDDPMNIVRQKQSNFNKSAIDDTNTLLNDNDLKIAAEKILKARQLVVLGEGGSGCSAHAAQIEFMQIGLNCSYYADSYMQMLSCAQLDKRDVILAITHSGRASNTIDSVKYAHERGVYTIGITSIHHSIFTKYCDTVLYISNMQMDFFSNTTAARICELSTLSIIHRAIVQTLQANAPAMDELVQELYEIKRVPPGSRV